jgi:hypothetical protein
VRIDRVRKPLEAPYEGPFPLVKLHDKIVVITLPTGQNQTVSIDRVKPVNFKTKTSTSRKTPLEKQEQVPDNARPESQETSSEFRGKLTGVSSRSVKSKRVTFAPFREAPPS